MTKKILLGTTNPSKVRRFREFLNGYDVEICTLKDLGIIDEPQETGCTPEENAILKAKFYGKYFDAVICNDSGLYFDDLDLNDSRQPGLNVRTPEGRRLDDEEMRTYYSALVHSMGGQALAYYIDGIAVYHRGKIASFMEDRESARQSAFYMTDKPLDIRHPGWPLDSMCLNRNTMIYFVEGGNNQYDDVEENIIVGEYRKRLIGFLAEALELKGACAMYQLKNEEITLTISALGAEMKSLKDNRTGVEYLWQADPKYWGRTSPILFPLVGNYKNKETFYDGKCYPLSQHGFARDMEFGLVSETTQEIWFALRATEETLKVFPFTFVLSIGYRLNGRTVEVLWKVENTDLKKMYFSIGGHPAFNCPVVDGEAQTDYKLAFDAEGTLVSKVIGEGGTLSDREKVFILQGHEMEITETLFDEDALIFEERQVQEVSLVSPQGKKYLVVQFDAPLVGIWSPTGKAAPFVCIEPWYGRCDRADFNQKLEEREWGNELEAGETFTKSYTITVG